MCRTRVAATGAVKVFGGGRRGSGSSRGVRRSLTVLTMPEILIMRRLGSPEYCVPRIYRQRFEALGYRYAAEAPPDCPDIARPAPSSEVLSQPILRGSSPREVQTEIVLEPTIPAPKKKRRTRRRRSS